MDVELRRILVQEGQGDSGEILVRLEESSQPAAFVSRKRGLG